MSKQTKESERADSVDFENKGEERKLSAPKTSQTEIIENYLSTKYDFRFNVIKCKPEFKELGADKRFAPIDKYKLNSLKRELAFYGIKTSPDEIKQIIESDFAPAINPIQEYFSNLSKWVKASEPNYIKELADTVSVTNPEKWVEYLTKWLVAVVANAMTNIGCQNHTCLVLTGGQGKFKTTWLDNLCPKSIQNYIFTGKIDPTNKDSLTYIAEFLFVNIDDQLKQLNKKDENELKNLITTPSVKYRRPYDPWITEYPHLASFMASVNGNDFLTDPTGSRRFLPFEVMNIDINKAKSLNMDHVYRQAVSLWKEGFRYWFNDKEVEELHENNQLFNVVTIEEQLVLEFYDKPAHRGQATHFLQSAMIQTEIEMITKQKLSSKKLGEALLKLGYERWQQTHNNERRWVYSVIKREGIEREKRNDAFHVNAEEEKKSQQQNEYAK